MPDNWYYRTGRKQHGPVSLVRIAKMLQNGALVSEDLVRQGEDGEWQQAGSCPGLGDTTSTSETPPESAASPADPGPDSTASHQISGGEAPDGTTGAADAEQPAPSELPELTELPDIAELPELTNLDELELCEADSGSAQSASDRSAGPGAPELELPDEDTLQEMLDGASSTEAADLQSASVGATDQTSGGQSAPGWYCQVFGYLMGPMPFADLQLLARNGEIGPDDRVREGRNEQWRVAGTVPDLIPPREAEPDSQDDYAAQGNPHAHSDSSEVVGWPTDSPQSNAGDQQPVFSGDHSPGTGEPQGYQEHPTGYNTSAATAGGLSAGALSAAVADATTAPQPGTAPSGAGTTMIQVNIPLPGGGVQTIEVPIQLEAALQSGSSPSIAMPTQATAAVTGPVPTVPVPAAPAQPAAGPPAVEEPARPSVKKSKKKRKRKSEDDEDGDDRWYCRLNDTVHGPVTAEQLNRLALAGRLQAEDEVRLGKEGAWTPAGLFPELFEPDEDHPVGIDLEQLMANRSEIVQETGSDGSPGHSENLAGMMRHSQAEMIRDPEKFRRVEEVEEELTTADRLRKNARYIVLLVIGLGILLARMLPSSDADIETFRLYQSIYDRFVEIRENGADTTKYNALKEESVPKIKPILDDLDKTASAAEPVKQHLLWAGKDHLIPMLDDARSEPSENEEFFVDHMENARKILEAQYGGALPSAEDSPEADSGDDG